MTLSTQYLSPYIKFQGRAREAMEFYQKVLGGQLVLRTVDETGSPKLAGPGDRITHAQLSADGAQIFGVDGHPKYPAKVGENVALAFGGTDRPRLTKIFHDLAEGGQTKMPLTKQPEGIEVGYLLDKFSINWVVSIEKT
jgi:PhnB protein